MEALHRDDPIHIGPYRTLVRFRETASSLQYLAHAPDGSTAVITRGRPELSKLTAFQRQFAAEAHTGGQLAGGWVQTLLDSRTTGEDLWTARGYVPALTLGEAVALAGPLPVRAVRVLGAALAETLARVHATGAVHQGLAADTVLLAADGPRLTAFGALGAAASARPGPQGRLSVQLGYLTPEQASGARPVPASDVFVLGHLLAYAATGTSPFPGSGTGRLGDAAPDLRPAPEELRDLLVHCLARNPQDRPNPTEIADRLAPEGPAKLAANGWLPGRILSAVTAQASAVLALESSPLADRASAVQALESAPPAAPPTSAPTSHPNAAPALTPHPATTPDSGPHHPAGSPASPPPTTLDHGPSTPTTPPAPPTSPTPTTLSPTRRSLLTGLIGAAAGLAVGGGSVYALTSGDSRGMTPAPAPRPKLPGTSPDPLWHYRYSLAADPADTGMSDSMQTCVWRNQVLVLTGRDQPATGIDIRTGRVLWTQKTLNVPSAARAADTEHCFVIDEDKGVLIWFGARDGIVKRRIPLDTALGDTFVSVQDTLVSEGPVVWLSISVSSALQQKAGQYVVAYDMVARKELWRSLVTERAAPVTLAPVAVRPEGIILKEVPYSVDQAVRKKRKGLQHLFFLDRRTGKKLWAKEFAGVRENAGLTIAPTGPLYAAVNENLDALDLTTGKRLWRAPATPRGNLIEPFGFGAGKVHGSTLYIGSNSTTVLALDTATGTLRWSHPTEEPSNGINAVSVSDSGRTVVSLGAGQLTAFDAREGTLRWKFTDIGESVKGDTGRRFPVYGARLAGRTVIAFRGRNIYALALD
ncbi:PQQ-binding-like beta-propeller repeat protein [Streptomyces sp. NPDC051561]|uniref:outer membrane protein assembly factor BamB family protein n=1 Tax=Streptomyces sp. NPDC051561 TaxID=3365658 RepID=UPI0037A4FF64